MAKKSIGIDLDDTLNCLLPRWLADYNEKYNDSLIADDVADWDWTKFVKPECGKDIYKFLSIPEYFRHLDVKPYAQEVIPWLQQFYDVYIVSAAHYEVTRDKGRYLKENFPTIPYQNIIFCNNKNLIHTDYLIDDGLHNHEVFTGTSLLFDAPHNRKDTKYPRFYNWLEIKDYFMKELNLA